MINYGSIITNAAPPESAPEKASVFPTFCGKEGVKRTFQRDAMVDANPPAAIKMPQQQVEDTVLLAKQAAETIATVTEAAAIIAAAIENASAATTLVSSHCHLRKLMCSNETVAEV